MYLYFTHVNSHGTVHNHSLPAAELEVQLDVLNTYVAFGYILLRAYLMDEKGMRTDLPIEAFDGQSLKKSMQKLQSDYESVLSS